MAGASLPTPGRSYSSHLGVHCTRLTWACHGRSHAYARGRACCRAAVKIPEVSQANFDDEVLKADKPVLVEYWATWCGPCKLMDPVLKKISAEHGERLKVVKIEVNDANAVLVKEYEVYGLPTFQIFQDGALVVGSSHEGALNEAGLLTHLEAYEVTLS